MKRRIILILTVLCTICISKDVVACGEITGLTSSVGTVESLGSGRYLITVPEGTKEVSLNGTTEAKFVQGFGPRSVSTGNGSIELRVDGTECGGSVYSYTVEFKELLNRVAENETVAETETTTTPDDTTNESDEEPPISEPNYGVLTLSKLEISGIEFTFDPNTHTYDLDFDEATDRLTIDAVASSTSSKVNISDSAYNLKQGENIISISLEDAYGNTGLYVLNINKTAAKSPNNFLARLTISNHPLNFDPSIDTYTVEIGKEKTLDIKAVTESELATSEILGNENLEDGSSIIVRVTAENGTTKDYTINIKKSFNIMDYWMYIAAGLLVLLLILLLIISKQKKNKKKATGPQNVENDTTTAGVVQDIAPENQKVNTVETFTDQSTGTSQSLSGASMTLKIIEPTNLEESSPVGTSSVDEDNSPTEVFQL